MKRIWILLLIVLCSAMSIRGQNYTSVTAAVIDTNGNAYSYGSYNISLVNNTGIQPQLGGNSTFQQVYSGSLDGSGNLSVSLPSVSVMTPNGMQWAFLICANPKQYASTFPQPVNTPCFTYTSTGTQISGSSVVLTTSFSVPVIPISPTRGPRLQTNSWAGQQKPGQVGASSLTTIYNSGLFDALPGITTYGPNNSYLVVTFMHSAQGDSNTDGVAEYTTSGDGGQTWSTPATIFTAPANFHEQDTNLVTLRRDGSLLLTGFIESNSGSPTQAQCYVIRGTWTGSIITWGTPTFLGPAFPSTPNGNGVCTDKVLELQNGNLLLTTYALQSGATNFSTGVYTGTWSGNQINWSSSATLIAAGTATEQYNETGLVQSPNGTILAMIRHDVSSGTVGYSQSTSTNNGATWSALTQTLGCGSSTCGRPAMGINPSGKIVLTTAINGTTNQNYVTSDNGGSTWTSPATLASIGEYSSMVWLGNGAWAEASGIGTVFGITSSIQLNFFYDGSGGSSSNNGAGMQQISQQVVSGTSTTSITFSNIPPNYSKLILDIVAADSTAVNVNGLLCTFNGDTTAADYGAFNWQGGVSGNGAAVSIAFSGTSGIGCGATPGSSSPANSMGSIEMTFLNYANTSFTKNFDSLSVTQSTNATLGSLIKSNYFGQWNSTAAINSIKITDASGGHIVAGSTFTLYGVQ